MEAVGLIPLSRECFRRPASTQINDQPTMVDIHTHSEALGELHLCLLRIDHNSRPSSTAFEKLLCCLLDLVARGTIASQ